MKLVKIKTWRELEQECIFDLRYGSLLCGDDVFTPRMEELMPDSRIIEINEFNDWRIDGKFYYITEQMIKEEL